ncbi:MAG TPA: peptidoglycan-associated lipoprotein Pal [Rhodocyclaceae bacterium]|nr:peptidoglycan-associated lipoprotein Pal [Rhodocyclaceae bacterium]
MRKLLFVAAASLILAACGSQPPAPEQTGASVTDSSASAVKNGAQAQPVSPDKLDMTSLAALKDPRSILSKRSVFFDYNQYVIKAEYQPLLEAHARFLIANPKMKMLIQGNTDERGSREYNVALGQKRADAVKKALLLLGVKEDQLEAVSLGEEKPRNPGHDEAAWAENRRADMLYSGEY